MKATAEQVFTTAACGDWRRCGSAARVTRAMPVTFTSSTRAHSASLFWLTSPTAPTPALFTRTSRPPSRSTTSLTAASIAGVSVTSQPRASTPGAPSVLRSRTATRTAPLEQTRGRCTNPARATCDDGDEPLEVGHVGVLSAEQRIDMDLGPRAGRLRPFASEHGADLLKADGGGDERPGIDGTTRVRRDSRVEARRA